MQPNKKQLLFTMKIFRNFRSKNLEKRLQMTRNRSFHSSIRHTLLCSRLMGLFPLCGLLHCNSEKLRFTLRSPYTIIYVISMFGQFLMCFFSVNWLLHTGISLTHFTNALFYTSSLTSSLLLLNIGRSWPNFILRVEAIEKCLPPFTRNVTRLCNMTMVFILFAAMVEHVLSVCYGVTVARACHPRNVTQTYFSYGTPWIFDYTEFALWKGVFSEAFNLQSTFIWSFNDLLIMVISIYLTEHFITHNNILKHAVHQENFSAAIFRLQYLKIARLVRLINGQIGIYILTSFGSNLYFICLQLFYCLNHGHTGHFVGCHEQTIHVYDAIYGFYHRVYFIYSCSFLVARTMMVLLLAARIHSNSKASITILYGLPSEKFDIEVQRYIAQINNIKVALSGLDFFYVTRTMILTLLGTIVTYELVLLQFNK